ncbi:MAG TPA: hypothetical protein VGE42_06710 [Candidatus Dormibacteraeota bacterium]
MPRIPVATLRAPVVAALTACGSAAAPTVHCTVPARPDPPSPSAVAGVVGFAADRGWLVGPGTIAFTATVRGPARFRADCSGPLQVVVSDAADIHVFSAAPPAVKGVPCGVVSLPRGRSAEYELSWRVDPSLPSGPYEVTLVLGDQPPTTLPVRLGRADPVCR